MSEAIEYSVGTQKGDSKMTVKGLKWSMWSQCKTKVGANRDNSLQNFFSSLFKIFIYS